MSGRRCRLFCQQAGIKSGGESRRVQRALTDFGADESFEAASRKFHEHYGVEVSVYRTRKTTYQHARNMAAQVPPPCRALAPKGAAVIIAEGDGCMAPTATFAEAPDGADRRKYRKVEYKEIRLVAAQVQGSTRTRYAATLDGVEAAGDLWENTVTAAGHAIGTRVHGVGDGAPWVAAQCLRRLGPDVGYLLDLYHVCDYFAAVWPGDRSRVQLHRDHLKAGQIETVLAALRAQEEPAERPDTQAPARCALRYLQNRMDQLDYPAALAANLPIGSGLIESGNRHVLQRRLKQAGAWWLPDNLNIMACLRTTRASGDFDAYWSKN